MAFELFNEDERDVLAEIVNIAMGKAGASLAEAFAGFIHLQVPEISTVEAVFDVETLKRLAVTYPRISIIHQEFIGELAGDIAVILGPASYAVLRDVLGFDDRDADGRQQREELLLELGNALASTCVMEIGGQLGLRTGLKAPHMTVFDTPAEEVTQRLCQEMTLWKGQTLKIGIIFHLEEHDVPFELTITVHPNCLQSVKLALAKFL